MLPRDVPKRTTFHDPVAERQMTQADAKLFYHRNKLESRSGSAIWNQTPQESPVMLAGSRGTTDYGGESLLLDNEEGEEALTY